MEQLIRSFCEPRPPLSLWISTAQMLREVFADMNDTKVVEFVLHKHPKDDIEFLKSSGYLVLSEAGTTSSRQFITHQPQQDTPEHFGVHVSAPMHKVGNLVLGLSVESVVPNLHTLKYFRSSDLLFHYVLNRADKRSAAVALDCINGIALVQFHTVNSGCMLHFRLSEFLNAFGPTTNFALLESILVWSYIWQDFQVAHELPSLLPKDTGPCLKAVPHTSEFKLHDSEQNVLLRTEIAAYERGNAIYSIPAWLLHSGNDGTYVDTVSTLKNWAMAHILQRIDPVVKTPLSVETSRQQEE